MPMVAAAASMPRIAVVGGGIGGLAAAAFLHRAVPVPADRAHHPPQQASRDRARSNHLPDGPQQQGRDAALAGEDPLVANDWIYSYDPEATAAEIAD